MYLERVGRVLDRASLLPPIDSHSDYGIKLEDEQTLFLSPPLWDALFMTLHPPIPLSLLFLLALSSDAYTHTQSELGKAQLSSWLSKDGRIVRQEETYVFFPDPDEAEIRENNGNENMNGVGNGLKYKVMMAEPVMQGIVTSVTQLFIAESDKMVESQAEKGAVDAGTEDGTYSDGGLSIDDESDGVEIADDFFAGSVLGSIPPCLLPSPSQSPPPQLNVNKNNSASIVPQAPMKVALFIAAPLDTPIETDELGLIGGDESSNSLNDKEARVFIRTRDLGRAGFFNGDWAVLDVHLTPSPRLVRVFALPSSRLSTPVASTPTPEPLLHLSPVLLASLSNSSLQAPLLSLRPLGTSSTPRIPTASSATVVRVPGPHSVEKRWQSAFLKGLKSHFDFETNKGARLVKIGDLIAVSIGGEGGEDEQDDHPLWPAAVPHSAVFFKITQLGLPTSTRDQRSSSSAITNGDLGFLIDTRETKMMQTGLERSRVPDLTSWLGLVSDTPVLPSAYSPLTAPSSPYARVLSLSHASLRPDARDYELHLSVIFKGARGAGKRTVARWVASSVGLGVVEVNCFDLVGQPDVHIHAHLRARFEKAAQCAPCILLLRHVDAFASKSQALQTGQEPSIANVLLDCFALLRHAWTDSGFPVLVFGTTADADKVPASVLGCFKQEISFEAPGEPERLDILQTTLATTPIAPDVSLKSIATQTAALVASDLGDLVARARLAAMDRVLKTSQNYPGVTPIALSRAGVALTGEDFSSALSKARASYSESIGAPNIPNVTWDDVGGLANVKTDILDTIQLPLEHPELFADGMKKRSGILLYGPPGTGKTLLAKAVATSCSLNFFSVKGPELLNMYIGESEANVRRVFQRARDAKPCVIFFDELDSVAPKRGNQGDSGGVMDRIVSQLLAELDGMSEGKGGADVFVIGATNRPDLLDPALLRPGRFDRMLYLGVSDTHDAQLKIIQALTRKFKLDPLLDLRAIAEECPFNFTGADFYALCSDAMLKSMARKAEEIDEKIAKLNAQPPPYSHPHPLTPQYYLGELATPSEIEVLVSQVDFEAALRELSPSVSQEEMEHYKIVQRRYANDTINSKEKIDQKKVAVIEHEQPGTVLSFSEPPVYTGKGKGKALV
uniref:Peroxisomal ATPase PEX6 n=1 Tax=Bartheletia paradoxa TaxID=669517 RepID=A0A2D0XHU2_9BASI|nr:hypothetical protein SPAR01853 [Bartheletia paradoxa]